MPHTLTWKLTIAFVLVAITASLLVGISLRLVNPAQFNNLVVSQQRSDFKTLLVNYYETNQSWQGVDEYMQQQVAATQPVSTAQPSTLSQSNAPKYGQAPDGPNPRHWRNQFGLADAQGVVRIPMMPELSSGTQVPSNLLAQGEPVIINGERVGTILTAPRPPSLSPEESKYLARVNIALVLASLGAFLGALLVGVLLARTLTRPLQSLTQAAQRMAGGDLEQEVTLRSRDEIGELAGAFNQMSRAVAQANHARQQMAVDVAHELRTPLTVVSGYIESMRDGVLLPSPQRLSVIYAEIEHLQHLVEDLRILSQADAGELKMNRRPVSPVEFLRQAQATYEQQAMQKGVTLELDTPESIPPVSMDETRMAQVIANLVSNALRHTPAHGRIILGAREDSAGVVLTVQDSGTGISPEDLPHIFNRFYRADDGGTSGLGLAIARALVTAHGGTLQAESSKGNGTLMRIRLPRVDS